MGLRGWYKKQKAAYGRYERFYTPHGKDYFHPTGTIDELVDFLDDMRAYPSIQYRFDNFKAGASRTLDTIRYSPFKIKCAYQRVRYGVSERDIWSFDYYLAEIIARGMAWLDGRDVLDRTHEQEDWNRVKSYMSDLANERVGLQERMEREPEAMEAFARIFPSLWE